MNSIVKRKSATVYVPDKDTLFKCLDTATTVEAKEYVLKRATEAVTLGGLLSKARDMLQTLTNIFTQAQQQEDNKPSPWEIPSEAVAKTPLTDFQNKQREITANAFAILSEKMAFLNNVQFQYAINEQSQVVCGFPDVDDALAAANLDRLFLTWLAKNKVLAKDGLVYHTDSKGKVLRDATGSEKKVSAEQFTALVENPKSGFKQALMKNGISLETVKMDYQEVKARTDDPASHKNLSEAPASDSPAPAA